MIMMTLTLIRNDGVIALTSKPDDVSDIWIRFLATAVVFQMVPVIFSAFGKS